MTTPPHIYRLEVDWDDDGDFDHTSSDVSSDLLSVKASRGRDYASQVYGHSTAGSLTATLRNDLDQYSRFNSTSLIYGLAAPGRRVRLSMPGSGATATAVLAGGAVASITVTAGGSGYTSTPTVSITGGGGTGATATAVVTSSAVSSITVTAGGSGYTTAPTVSLTGGGGTGATATAVVTGSAVTSITVTAGGSGYTTAPTVSITGGGGTGATATAVLAGSAVASITVTAGGSGYTTAPTVSLTNVLWAGQLDSLRHIERRSGNNTVQLLARGPLIELTQREVEVPMQAPSGGVTIATATGVVLDAAGIPASRRGSIGGARTMARWWSTRQPAVNALRELEETEIGFLHETRDGLISMDPENHRLTGDRRIASMPFTADETTGIPLVAAQLEDPGKDIANIIRIPVRTFTVGTAAVLWTLLHTVALAQGDTHTFLAQYPAPGSTVGDVGVDAWTAMVATTDYTANSQANGMGTDLTSSLTVTTVAATDTAISRRITVTNSGTTTLIITHLQTRGTPLSEAEPTVVEVRDQFSIDDYGEQTYLAPAQYISTIADAESYGGFLLSLVKEPQTRARVTFEASSFQAEAQAIDLSNRVRLMLNGREEEHFVEAISHEILRGERHLVGLLLSPATPYGSIYILDSASGLDEGILAR